MVDKRAIPITPPGPLWSQREYVTCMQMGIQFAAHRAGDMYQWFHYGFPEDINCTSVLVGVDGPKKYVDHNFTRDIEWIKKCAAAVTKE
jgi:hypothetical protein